MPTPWVVTQASLAGFLQRARVALLVVAPRPRFSPAVARAFAAEHGDVSFGTLATARWLLEHVGPLFADASSLDEPPDGYYLFRDAGALAHHPGALDREPVPLSIRGVIAAAADATAKAIDPLDAVSARAVIAAFEQALIARPPPRRVEEGSPYALLQIPPSATDAELKAARDRALLQNHPDRVAHMSEDIRALAVRKTQAINDAYAAIRALRAKT